MNDMHTHTLHSSDSRETMAAYIKRARKIGVTAMCFTDHVYLSQHDHSIFFYKSDDYFRDLGNAKTDARDITLLAGIEFDCPHRYPEKLDELAQLPYDCIIGSVHFCGLTPDLFFSELVKTGVPTEECYAGYWREVLKCVKNGGFDVLGHMDIPKRYYKTLIYDEKMLREIFRVMVDNGIVPEINTSSLRANLPDPMPGYDLLEIYRGEGGKFVTFGSDAHTVADLADNNAAVQGLIRQVGLSEVIFVEREMKIV